MAREGRIMELRRYSIPTEVRKHLKGKPSKLSAESLVHIIGPHYLAAVNAEKAEAHNQIGVDELERLFRLEDPRG